MELTLEMLLAIALAVGVCSIVLSTVLDRRGPYLLMVIGARNGNLLARVVLWSLAILAGAAGWFALSWAMPSVVAVALFFALEAGLLDICTNRVAFVYSVAPTDRRIR